MEELKPTKGTIWINHAKARVGVCRTQRKYVVFVDDGTNCKAVFDGSYDACVQYTLEHWKEWNE